MPGDEVFVQSCVQLLLRCLRQYAHHRLGGIMVMVLASFSQFFKEGGLLRLNPSLREAVVTGKSAASAVVALAEPLPVTCITLYYVCPLALTVERRCGSGMLRLKSVCRA